MTKVNINIKKLNSNATIPTYGTEFSAGADLYACLENPITIEPGKTEFIHTDLYFYSYLGSGNQSDNADGRFNSYGRCHIIKHVNVNLFSVFPDDSDVYGSVH